MATHTKRDQVWNAALQLACRTDRFTVSDVTVECADDNPAERTVRDVLRTMADDDWLENHTSPEDGQRLYSAGVKLGDGIDRPGDST